MELDLPDFSKICAISKPSRDDGENVCGGQKKALLRDQIQDCKDRFDNDAATTTKVKRMLFAARRRRNAHHPPFLFAKEMFYFSFCYTMQSCAREASEAGPCH